MKKLFAIIPLLLLALTQCLDANPESNRDLAEELLDAMRFEDVIMKTVRQIVQIQLIQLEAAGAANAQTDKDELKAKIDSIVDRELVWQNIKDDYIEIYSQKFTDKELKGLISFHKSTLGQKYLDSMPELMIESLRVSEKRVSGIIEKVLGEKRGKSNHVEHAK